MAGVVSIDEGFELDAYQRLVGVYRALCGYDTFYAPSIPEGLGDEILSPEDSRIAIIREVLPEILEERIERRLELSREIAEFKAEKRQELSRGEDLDGLNENQIQDMLNEAVNTETLLSQDLDYVESEISYLLDITGTSAFEALIDDFDNADANAADLASKRAYRSQPEIVAAEEAIRNALETQNENREIGVFDGQILTFLMSDEFNSLSRDQRLETIRYMSEGTYDNDGFPNSLSNMSFGQNSDATNIFDADGRVSANALRTWYNAEVESIRSTFSDDYDESDADALERIAESNGLNYAWGDGIPGIISEIYAAEKVMEFQGNLPRELLHDIDPRAANLMDARGGLTTEYNRASGAAPEETPAPAPEDDVQKQSQPPQREIHDAEDLPELPTNTEGLLKTLNMRNDLLNLVSNPAVDSDEFDLRFGASLAFIFIEKSYEARTRSFARDFQETYDFFRDQGNSPQQVAELLGDKTTYNIVFGLNDDDAETYAFLSEGYKKAFLTMEEGYASREPQVTADAAFEEIDYTDNSVGDRLSNTILGFGENDTGTYPLGAIQAFLDGDTSNNSAFTSELGLLLKNDGEGNIIINKAFLEAAAEYELVTKGLICLSDSVDEERIAGAVIARAEVLESELKDFVGKRDFVQDAPITDFKSEAGLNQQCQTPGSP